MFTTMLQKRFDRYFYTIYRLGIKKKFKKKIFLYFPVVFNDTGRNNNFRTVDNEFILKFLSG